MIGSLKLLDEIRKKRRDGYEGFFWIKEVCGEHGLDDMYYGMDRR